VARASEILTTVVLTAALGAYAVVALAVQQWWLSGVAAPVVAGLLVARHRRARFAAYVFLSVAVVRGVTAGWWSIALGAGLAIAILQAAPARRLWPRLSPSWRRGRRIDNVKALL
jgi:hypothetical protein